MAVPTLWHISKGGTTIIAPILMVLVSAVLHAFWNLHLKKSPNKVLFSYLYVWSAILLYTPVFLVLFPKARIPWQGWACILSTGSIFCFYFTLLAKSYSHGDLSHAYPIARGIAPMLTLVWAVTFLGERPSALGMAGILLIIVSMFLFHPPTEGKFSLSESLSRLRQPASVAALGTGASISLYSVVDKIGVSFVDPTVYIYMTFLVAGLLLSPYYLNHFGLSALKEQVASDWRQALLVGFLCVFGYLIVLSAMRLTQVSYIIPLRSTSILFAVLLGFEVLGEQKTDLKVLAAAAMMAGVALIALS